MTAQIVNRRRIFAHIALIVCAIMIPIGIKSLLYTSYSVVGIVVAGTEICLYEGDNVTELQALRWGNIEVNQLNTKYCWLRALQTEAVRVHFYSDNPTWLNFEVFWESSPGRWSRWANDTLTYFRVEWTKIMFRLTALGGAPAGPFSFTIYFSVV